MMSAQILTRIIGALVTILAPVAVIAASAGKAVGVQQEYSPYANRRLPRQVFWGDTHVHTNLSADAGSLGNFNLGPEEAYRFARGEQVTANNGMQAKLIRPLDFLVVADHAFYMGLIPMVRKGNPALTQYPNGQRWYDWYKAGKEKRLQFKQELIEDVERGQPRIPVEGMARSSWNVITKTAERFNDPGKFTAFIGYEWTSTPNGNNLHRVVIFKDGADKAGKILPFSQFDSTDPEDLWRFLADYEATLGGRVLAIPHNANVSGGLMFDTRTFTGKPMTTAYAQTRARFEPLHEVTQIKGDSETHPQLSPDDEFADYETLDKANVTGHPLTLEMLPGSYARSALKQGLQLGATLGVNPFKHGFIGSTDSHTSLATAGENNFFGKLSLLEPQPDRWRHIMIPSANGDPAYTSFGADMAASGLAAIWARENTREALFEAMERRETYATTGTRIQVRLFGGWNFGREDIYRPDFAEYGYSRGVPMGGDLSEAPGSRAPCFIVSALRDPDGANLDRIQIVKGWLDASGNSHEKVYNAALSDSRKVDAEGNAPPVGNTVDSKTAGYANTIGDPQLLAYWRDPDFDAGQSAFYYVRVLEIPTPRWTAYDARRFGTNLSKDTRVMHQERAYTSAIWYTP